MVDLVLREVYEHCAIVIFDGESCNQGIKAAIHGTLDGASRRALEGTSFFEHLQHTQVKGLEDLPHLPIQACTFDGSYIFALPGPAHACKNSAGQVMSECKLLHFGSYAADCAGALSLDMPIPAFCRKDPMSDRLCSLLSNPFFLVHCDDP